MSFRADLHCHSTYSDGTETPEQLIDLAIEKGLSALSITDHDTVAGYAFALPYAQKQHFPLLTGVEFSASYRGEPIHILGYGVALADSTLLSLCARHIARRRNRNLAIIGKLKEQGIALDPHPFEQSDRIVGRPHIALALMEKGVVESVKEAFERYLGEGKCAYVAGDIVEVEETIGVIQQAGGKAILAHPQLIRKKSTFRALLTCPFDGLEGYYASLPAHREREYLQAARAQGWLITGGSDYHGAVKPQARLGSSWVDEETFAALSR